MEFIEIITSMIVYTLQLLPEKVIDTGDVIQITLQPEDYDESDKDSIIDSLLDYIPYFTEFEIIRGEE